MISRNGVVYDLEKSPFIYLENGMKYVFSSQLHLDKFKARKKENRDIINYSLTKRFKLNCDVSLIADIVLYRKIETRGFLIYSCEGNKLCLITIKLGGVKVM